MKKILALLTLLGLVVIIPVAYAAEFMAAGKDGNISIGSSETHRNLYIAGGNVSVNSPISGDLFAAGGGVNITGNVEQDLFAAGGNINVAGNVGGDARVAGGSIVLNNPVGGDLLVAGGNVSVVERATIGGDLVTGAGNLNLEAPVAGGAKIAGGVITINGKITGDVVVRADEQLTFGPRSEVLGKIKYSGPKEAVIQEGAKVSDIEFTKISKKAYKAKGIFSLGVLVKILGYFIAAYLLFRYFGRFVQTNVEKAVGSPWASLGIGFVGLVLSPIIVFILFLTIVGYYAALAVLAAFLLSLVVSGLLAALFVGSLIYKWISKGAEMIVNWKATVLGVIALELLVFIPVVGWILCFAIFLIAFGSLLQVLKGSFSRET